MIRGLSSTSPEFREKLQGIAARNGWDADAIAAVMSVETGGTFSPSIRNQSSGAVGLIQFMPSTAAALGTTTADLAAMTATQQLDYVEQYLRRTLGSRRLSLRRVDYYLAVFWPAAIGEPMTEPFLRAPSRAYEANATAFDSEQKGYITPADLDAPLARAYGEQVAKKKALAGCQSH
jgi:hypothetical protein